MAKNRLAKKNGLANQSVGSRGSGPVLAVDHSSTNASSRLERITGSTIDSSSKLQASACRPFAFNGPSHPAEPWIYRITATLLACSRLTVRCSTPSAPSSSPPSVSSTGSVTLSWSANAENDLAGYKIYFGTSSGNYTSPGSPTVIGKVSTYTLTGLQRNTTYFFALSAYDNAGNESALSAEVSRSIL